MNNPHVETAAPASTRQTRQREERKKPRSEMSHQGCVTCPMCEIPWNSPDKRLIKFCKACRGKVPDIEVSSVVENDFIYL